MNKYLFEKMEMPSSILEIISFPGSSSLPYLVILGRRVSIYWIQIYTFFQIQKFYFVYLFSRFLDIFDKFSIFLNWMGLAVK